MRKENSKFNMSYISQPGVKVLHNNDYFGCSELEEFACYVVADGMRSGNEKHEDPSARLAVEAVIRAFNENPSLKKGTITKYLEAAHRAMRDNSSNQRRRASVTVVITDYQKLRYAYAGNCRFHLYRGGKVFDESCDQSLSWEMMEDGRLVKDKIALHAERSNLQCYCGIMKRFTPTVSKKIKLNNTDVFSLFTQGIWENAQSIDMIAAVQAAENDPQEAINNLERLILDKVPADGQTENYTACFIFIDKIYLDPEKKKNIKRIVIISIIVVLVILAIVIFLIWRNNRRENWHNNMQLAYHNGIEFIHGNNFIRAKDEMTSAYELAEKLGDKKYKSDINNYKLLIESIIYADDLLKPESYEAAVDAYSSAANQSRYADNLALDYIDKNREKATGYLNVHEYIFLGDSLADIRDWDNAEQKYLAARSLASRLYYTDGKKEANDALESLYQAKESDIQEQQSQAQFEITAAEFIIEGDNAMKGGDLVAAQLFYQLARDKYEEMGNEAIVASIDQKMELLNVKAVQNEYQVEYAADYVMAGNEMAENHEYIDAKRLYLLAREIYANLGDMTKLDEVQAKIDIVDIYLTAGIIKSTAEDDK